MIKKFVIGILGFGLVVAVLALVKAAQIKEVMGANRAQPVSAVTTTTVRKAQWQPVVNAIGSLAPVQGVTISAELEGVVIALPADNGAAVKKGDLLVELDTTVEQAQLDAAQARAELARLQSERAGELKSKNTVSQAEVDSTTAQYSQTVADVAAIQAALDKKAIRAPFDGRVGIRQVNLGQFVTRGTALIPLQQLDPMYVDFYVPQRQLPQMGLGQEVKVLIDAYADQEFIAQISAINPVVDGNTRNVAVQATLPNPDESLRAGMFARVEVVLPEVQNLVVVPTTAVAYAPYGNSVYVIEMMKDADGNSYLGARQQPVKLGRKRGDLIAVLEGLAGDEEIATSGVFKLRHALPVQVNNIAQPSEEVAPTPANT